MSSAACELDFHRPQTDLEDILVWLLKRGAGEAGLRWFFKLEDAIASLSEFPHRHPLAPEFPV